MRYEGVEDMDYTKPLKKTQYHKQFETPRMHIAKLWRWDGSTSSSAHTSPTLMDRWSQRIWRLWCLREIWERKRIPLKPLYIITSTQKRRENGGSETMSKFVALCWASPTSLFMGGLNVIGLYANILSSFHMALASIQSVGWVKLAYRNSTMAPKQDN
jgi:hypothetical protein